MSGKRSRLKIDLGVITKAVSILFRVPKAVMQIKGPRIELLPLE